MNKSNFETILKIEEVSIGYDKSGKINVLENLNVDINKGEITALVGVNGSGKSTLLRALTRKIKINQGNIFLNSMDYKWYSQLDYAKKISFVSTDLSRVSGMKVWDLVSLGRFPYTNRTGKLSNIDKEKIGSAIESVGMQNFVNTFANKLSDGECQKLMIARAIAQETDIILLDEPTAFLDIENKIMLIEILENLALNYSKSIIYSTHDLNMALKTSDKIWLVRNKNIIQGAPEDLILSGRFSDFFTEKKIIFNTESYNFVSLKTKSNEYCLEVHTDKSEAIKVTEKALERLGFVRVENADIKIILTNLKERLFWKLIHATNSIEFSSIYKMAQELKKIQKQIF